MAIDNTYSECWFVALFIQHASACAVSYMSSVASLTVPYFATLSHKRLDFLKEVH